MLKLCRHTEGQTDRTKTICPRSARDGGIKKEMLTQNTVQIQKSLRQSPHGLVRMAAIDKDEGIYGYFGEVTLGIHSVSMAMCTLARYCTALVDATVIIRQNNFWSAS